MANKLNSINLIQGTYYLLNLRLLDDLGDLGKIRELFKDIYDDFFPAEGIGCQKKPVLIKTELNVFDKAVEFIKSSLKESKSNQQPSIYTENSIKKIVNEKNIFLKELQILNNSSIWFRIIDKHENAEVTVKNFKLFNDLNLYEKDNALENLEYNLRIAQNNFLKDLVPGGHGSYITPHIYPDELECANDILSINSENNINDYKYPELIKYNDVALRILLIDDKVDKENADNSKVSIIANLMSGNVLKELAKNKISEVKSEKIKEIRKYLIAESSDSIEEFLLKSETKKGNDISNTEEATNKRFLSDLNIEKYYQERLLWKEKDIKSYIFHTKGEIKSKNEDKVKIIENLAVLPKTTENVLIIQVTNLKDAIELLSHDDYKFDLILMDYLLAPKPNNSSERELSTVFFEWLKDKDGLNPDIGYLKSQIANSELVRKEFLCNLNCSDESSCFEVCSDYNKQIRKKVSRNRGPLYKFWFFPITAFNNTLIDDLVNNGIRLIDYYWHIAKGADPITTPYLFLRQLNNFLYLQLENSVFLEDELFQFINKNISFIEGLKDNNNEIDFKKFSALMGAEYSIFVKDFLNRPLIYNDKDTSLFSKYIWDHFMNNNDNKNLFLAVQAYQKFLHRCAFGSRSEYKKIKAFWEETVFSLNQLECSNDKVFMKMNSLLNNLTFF